MSRKVAVALIHGVGMQPPDFADLMIAHIGQRFYELTGADDLVFRPIHWSPVLQHEEDNLWARLDEAGHLKFRLLRQFIVNFGADIIAYQQTPGLRAVYNDIHEVFAVALRELALEAGATAPLCIIAHSLGTAIASNYIYDLQVHNPPKKDLIGENVLAKMGGTPLEWGETFAHFYTLGSPVALWSLRFKDFGTPIKFPHPKFHEHHPTVYTEWLNIYDKDDIIGFPIQILNTAYRDIAKDIVVNAGSILSNWSPQSHIGYWLDEEVIEPITLSLATTWRTINNY